MIVFHGSTIAIPCPDTKHSHKFMDLGSGFYVATQKSQAVRWCQKFMRSDQAGMISTYELDTARAAADFSIKIFETYSEEWLNFILNCRDDTDCSSFDIVQGNILSDPIFNIIELYINELVSKEETLHQLQSKPANTQICFRNQNAIASCLKYKGSEKL